MPDFYLTHLCLLNFAGLTSCLGPIAFVESAQKLPCVNSQFRARLFYSLQRCVRAGFLKFPNVRLKPLQDQTKALDGLRNLSEFTAQFFRFLSRTQTCLSSLQRFVHPPNVHS